MSFLRNWKQKIYIDSNLKDGLIYFSKRINLTIMRKVINVWISREKNVNINNSRFKTCLI